MAGHRIEDLANVDVKRRRGEPFDNMLKRFNRLLEKSEVLEEVRSRMYYEKPSDKKRRRREEAEYRRQKEKK